MKLIVGLDLGKKTGIAKAYDKLMVAIPHKTVYSFKELITELKLLSPKCLVIGWPILMNGKPGLQCERVKSWVSAIIKEIDEVPLYYEDERFSTKEVFGSKDEDASSAAWILQKFLDKNMLKNF
ncbi:RuvX/YqgF family protein [Alphaproteobacteria bacterium endosymbiont of Tiliacea citrago]|uniref:RuvX/YqgF family protein n=1 Tax=Alphaproteobacteria bacterium endosymbiont of Tiliacea citrago TaxID=3077944 RepID=UPI00313CF938